MSSPLAYRRRASPLHAARAGAGAAYALALGTCALLVDHPFVAGALLVAVALAGAGADVREAISRAARRALPFTLLIVAVNLLVSRQGLTVFARLGELAPLGRVDLTVEALAFGLVFALKVLVLLLAFALFTAAVDPDELLRIFRRVSFRSALSAALATRMMPVLASDSRRLSEALRTRPPERRIAGARARLTILSAVLTGALDRALDVAATLEVRGYGAARRAPRRRLPWSRHDLAFGVSALLLLALAIAAKLGGWASWDAYPVVHGRLDATTLALAGGLVAIALAPFADRRGIEP